VVQVRKYAKFSTLGFLAIFFIGGACVVVGVTFLALRWMGHLTKPSDVPGTYTAALREGVDTLEVHPNGTFDQIFVPTTGKASRNSGTWQWLGNPNRVGFSNFLPRVEMDGRFIPSPQPIGFSLHLTQDIKGNLRLQFYDDPGLSYIKK
jgi:hypothetical protein